MYASLELVNQVKMSESTDSVDSLIFTLIY